MLEIMENTNKEMRTRAEHLIQNAILNTAYKCLNVLFPLIAIIYASNILCAEGIGKVAIAQNAAQYFVLLAPLGLPNYGTKCVARVRNNKEALNKVFSELFFINFLSTLLCVCGYYSMILIGGYFAEQRILFAISGLAIVFNFINVDWLFLGIEQYKYITIRNLWVKLLSLVLLLLLVTSKEDYKKYALIYVWAIGLNNIFNLLKLKSLGVVFSFRYMKIKRHLIPLLLLLINSVSIELYTLFDTSMLGYMCSDEVVGCYTNAVKLVRVLVTLLTAASGVLLPRMSHIHEQEPERDLSYIVNGVLTVMIYFMIPCMVGICTLSGNIMLFLYGESFLMAGKTLFLASFLIPVLSLSFVFGAQVLLTYNCEWKLLVCSMIGAVSNVFLNIILIPRFYQDGAIIASIASELLVAFFTFAFSKKYIHYKLKCKDAIFVIIGSLIVFLSVKFVLSLGLSNNAKVCIGIAVGVVTYFAFNILLNTERKKQILELLNKRHNG